MEIIEEDDLQALSKQMKADKLGLLVMFHASYCEYCERLEEDLLVPMSRLVQSAVWVQQYLVTPHLPVNQANHSFFLV